MEKSSEDRTLYYAVGGGFGHMTRGRAVLHTLGLEEGGILLSASGMIQDRRFNGGLDYVQLDATLATDSPTYRNWLERLIDEINPTRIIIDTFPGGILGEFCRFPFSPSIERIHVARLLNWKEYAPLLNGPLPSYHTIYSVEELTPDHGEYLRNLHAPESREIVPLDLIDPPQRNNRSVPSSDSSTLHSPDTDPTAHLRSLRRPDIPFWLIVHSGERTELLLLKERAEEEAAREGIEADIHMISPLRSPDFPTHNVYPATDLFNEADRVFTAGGFNLMRQLAPWREKHRYLPMERRFDLQHLRCSRVRSEATQET